MLFPEEILDSRTALWMSADGHIVLYATFNDSLVHEQKYPWYGAALDTDEPAKVYKHKKRLFTKHFYLVEI